MSRHDLVSAQTTDVYITCHDAIAHMCQTICNVTFSNVVGRWIQCELEGCMGLREGGGEVVMVVSGFGCKIISL